MVDVKMFVHQLYSTRVSRRLSMVCENLHDFYYERILNLYHIWHTEKSFWFAWYIDRNSFYINYFFIDFDNLFLATFQDVLHFSFILTLCCWRLIYSFRFFFLMLPCLFVVVVVVYLTDFFRLLCDCLLFLFFFLVSFQILIPFILLLSFFLSFFSFSLLKILVLEYFVCFIDIQHFPLHFIYLHLLKLLPQK